MMYDIGISSLHFKRRFLMVYFSDILYRLNRPLEDRKSLWPFVERRTVLSLKAPKEVMPMTVSCDSKRKVCCCLPGGVAQIQNNTCATLIILVDQH